VANEHYITLNMILSSARDSKELVEVLGMQAIDALLDLLLHVDGPRVRDRVSHGEAVVEEMPRVIADRLLGLFLFLAVRWNYMQVPYRSPVDEFLPPVVCRCVQFYAKYRSCFDATAMLLKEALRCHREWNILHSLLVTDWNVSSQEDNVCREIPNQAIYLGDRVQILHDSTQRIESFLCSPNQSLPPPIFATCHSGCPLGTFNDGLFPSSLLWSALQVPQSRNHRAILGSLRGVCVRTSTFCQALVSKLNDLRILVGEGRASRRLENSLYKLEGSVSFFSECIVWIMLAIVEGPLRTTDFLSSNFA